MSKKKRPLELIHSDLFGSLNPTSHDEKRSTLTFIDDFTHFTTAYSLRIQVRSFKVFYKI